MCVLSANKVSLWEWSQTRKLLLQVVAHSSQMIYTRMIGDAPEDEKENEGGVVVSVTEVQHDFRSY